MAVLCLHFELIELNFEMKMSFAAAMIIISFVAPSFLLEPHCSLQWSSWIWHEE